MGFLDSVFGGDDDVKIEQAELLTPEQKQALSFILPFLQDAIETGEFQDRTVDTRGLEETSLAGLEELAAQFAAGEGGLGQLGDVALTRAEDILTRGPQDFEEFFQKVVQEPALRSFEEDVAPRIREAFGGSSNEFFTGQRVEQEGRAARDLIESLDRERANLAFQTEQADEENAIRTLLGLPAIRGGVSDVNDILSLFSGGQAGSAERSRQRALDIELLLRGTGIPAAENIATVSRGQTGIIPSFIGGFGSGLAGGIF